MTLTSRLFMDVVNGRMVNEYIDTYGNKFMAQSVWGVRVQRVKTKL